MAKTKYHWRNGSRMRLDANKVGEELEGLYEAHGEKVKPQLLVDHAKDPDSILHEYFEWDNTQCGVHWREQQARQILNSIRIVRGSDPQPRIMNVHITKDKDNFYQRAEVAVTIKDHWSSVLAETYGDLQGVERRLEDLEAIERGRKKKSARNVRRAVTVARETAEAAIA